MINSPTRFSVRLRAAVICLLVVASSACSSGTGKAADAEVLSMPVADRLERFNQCALDAEKAMGIGVLNYPELLAKKGIVGELRADAESIAKDQIAFYERIAPSTSDTGRIGNYLAAIGEVGSVLTHSPVTRQKAKSLEAYYQSLVVSDRCALDIDILQSINKAKP